VDDKPIFGQVENHPVEISKTLGRFLGLILPAGLKQSVWGPDKKQVTGPDKKQVTTKNR
jgi:hypothetical protein